MSPAEQEASGSPAPEQRAPTRSSTAPPPGYPGEGLERLRTIRFGKMQHRGMFRSRTPGLIYRDKVVVQSERGIEVGEVALDAGRRPREEGPIGWVLRRATTEDLDAHRDMNEPLEPGPEFLFCRERIEALELPMRLVDVERPFGGGKIIFFFTADGRVDFRALVRDLAKRYRTRIEMKQIGVRDEAKILADIADCGRELCCRTFLTRLQPISMRMAKVQKTTLDPAKISGRCGRLKCCLRYEYDAYISLRESLPRSGTRVFVGEVSGAVVTMDVLSQMVTVMLESGERVTVHVGELTREPRGDNGSSPPTRSAARKTVASPDVSERAKSARPSSRVGTPRDEATETGDSSEAAQESPRLTPAASTEGTPAESTERAPAESTEGASAGNKAGPDGAPGGARTVAGEAERTPGPSSEPGTDVAPAAGEAETAGPGTGRGRRGTRRRGGRRRGRSGRVGERDGASERARPAEGSGGGGSPPRSSGETAPPRRRPKGDGPAEGGGANRSDDGSTRGRRRRRGRSRRPGGGDIRGGENGGKAGGGGPDREPAGPR